MKRDALLERGPLLEELRLHANAAFQRRVGRLVMVGGEAGVGKSSLVREFRSMQAAGVMALVGACDAMSAPRPLGPLLDFAHALDAELATLVDGGHRHAAFTLLLKHLGTNRSDFLIVLEDVHWADDATLDMLRFLGRRLEGSSTLVVCTYRDDEVGPTHALRRVLGDLAGTGTFYRLKVPPLTFSAVEQLAANTAVDAVDLHRRTGGNPFFVTEVLAGGEHGVTSEVPDRVADAVLARMSRLSNAARETLELAGTYGPTIETKLLEGLTRSTVAIDECIHAGLLVCAENDSALTFRHELARQALLSAMTKPQRVRRHAQVLAHLERELEGGRAVHGLLAALSHHAAEADDQEAVLRYAPAAARAAAEVHAYRETRVHLERSLRYAERLAVEERASLLDLYGRACSRIGDTPAATAAFRDAAALWGQADRREEQALSLRWQANSLGPGDDDALDEALRLARELPPGRIHATLFTARAWSHMVKREPRECLSWVRRATAAARSTDNPRAIAAAHVAAVGALFTADRVPEGRRHLQEVERLAAVSDDGEEYLVSAYTVAGTALAEVNRFDEAEGILERAERLTRKLDADGQLRYVLSWRAAALLERGRWQDAGLAATALLDRDYNREGISRVVTLVVLARLRIRRGDPEAWPLLDEALELADGIGLLQSLAPVRSARAEGFVMAGRLLEAQEEAAAGYRQALASEHHWFIGELAYWCWKAGGDPHLPERVRGPYALQVRGRSSTAARSWLKLGLPFHAARAMSETEDVAHLTTAHRTLVDLGARPAALAVAAKLRELGVRGVPRGPRHSTAQNPIGLTARESEVLMLLAKGLRNAEIAQMNGVSRRTVEHQVSTVLGKLDARSRTEAVVKARQLGVLER